jgi:hypothetical protein
VNTETTEPAPALPGVTRWRKRPTGVDAIQWTGANLAAVRKLAGIGHVMEKPDAGLAILMSYGWCDIKPGYWVGREGPSLLCWDAKTFAYNYEPAGTPETALEAPAPDDSGRSLTTRPEKSRVHAGASSPDGSEALGRLVREVWVTYVRDTIPDPKPSWVAPWDDLDGFQREAHMRIGHAVANYALTENAVTYGISCTSCAGHLDRANTERERAERAEAKLAAIRKSAEAWAALAPADDWGLTPADTVAADCGRAILAIIGTEGDPPPLRTSDQWAVAWGSDDITEESRG